MPARSTPGSASTRSCRSMRRFANWGGTRPSESIGPTSASRTPACSKPGCTRLTCPRLRRNRPLQTRSSVQIATCATIRTRRNRCRLLGPPLSFLSAGTRSRSAVVRAARPEDQRRHRRHRERVGHDPPVERRIELDREWQLRDRQVDRAPTDQRPSSAPPMPPARARMRLSVSNWRITRPRPAPSATRTAISRCRAGPGPAEAPRDSRTRREGRTRRPP